MYNIVMRNKLDYEGKVIRLANSDYLYVHKCDARALKCYKDNHTVSHVIAIVSGIDGKEYPVSVRYCTECDVYFISRISYNLYIEKLGFMLARLDCYEKEYSETTENEFLGFHRIEFNDTSPLSLMGYNVDNKTNTPDEVRHAFLSMVIDRGILPKDIIQNYLEQFLRVNSQRDNMIFAKEKWKSDLAFILQYNAENQPHVFIGEIVKWKNKRKHNMLPYTGLIDIDNTKQGENATPIYRGIYDKKQGDVKVVV